MNCKIAELKNDIFADGEILNFENNSVRIKCKVKKRIPLDISVYILVYNPLKGIIIFSGEVISFINGVIKITNLERIETRQRRNETRVKVEFTLLINKFQINEDRPIILHKEMLFKTVDISASGILLTSALDIPKNMSLYLELPIGESIRCVTKTVRKEKGKDGFYYGCLITGTQEEKIDRIREFVFRKQIEQYKKSSSLKVINF